MREIKIYSDLHVFQELDLAIFHLHWNCIWDLPENENVIVTRLTAVKSGFSWALSSKIAAIIVLHAKSYLIQNSHHTGKMSIKSFTKWHVMFWLCIKQYSTFLKNWFLNHAKKSRATEARFAYTSDSFRIFHVAGCLSEAKRSAK